jgi:hypothetical protein
MSLRGRGGKTQVRPRKEALEHKDHGGSEKVTSGEGTTTSSPRF